MNSYDQIFNDAERNYIHGNFQFALELFEKALSLKKSEDCFNYIACCYLNLGELVKAKKILKELTVQNHTWELPIMNVGRVNLKLGNLEDALECFESALKIEPSSEDANFYLGVYHFQVKDYLTAKMYYERSLSIDNEQSEVHLNLGLCYLNLNDFEAAIKEFKQAYFLDCDCTKAIYNQGLAHYLMGNYRDALKYYLRANEQEKDDPEIMYDIAHCYYKCNEFEKSIHWGNQVLKIDHKHKNASKLVKNVVILKGRG
ncbi:tetratricopeptide repeat protein [Brevibacillus sp. SYSU BS000544]|uniref:tetratricopeptide repeat protein n=1 Tax=Brevibacillus sp. SYSU BS000544 TaxID=3416443 RepID=UPI003CE5C40D